ncbi:hypothetical protein OTK49_00985 [Vibrio coralliirubri]|uniref:hypothetical protein n=1 Tax=Vibrio coralliirubri TaxID=1516159 RepID=UPI002283A005|nr:hypothetical protein [Vibrio coralliirubri]MCY9861105.1 hypothetical protein [Vibrio coralliirubri]
MMNNQQQHEKQLIINQMRTPDGTLLISYHTHDFVSHTDANGDEYFVDGGTSYQRHSVNNEPLIDESIYVGADHELIREHFTWGTRGKDGLSPLEFKPLKDLTSEHIKAILETQTRLPLWRKDIFNAELSFRA